MRAPDFWRHDGLAAEALAPLGWAWETVGRLRRVLKRPWRAPVPVISVGNLIAGGAGKTPVALAIAALAACRTRRPHFVSRGYGGREVGPLRIDPARHDARDVGDEPLLLARVAPCWVARDRAAGARAAVAAGAGALILDDAHQNSSLAKDLSLVVIDGGYGFGNDRVMPAGPLRERRDRGIARADAAIIVGEDRSFCARSLPPGLPCLSARLVPTGDYFAIAEQPVLAFAGIGRPAKFFETLREIGCDLVRTQTFPDHHRYCADEIMRLCEQATAEGLIPITTAKDFVRLPPEARPMVRVLEIRLVFDDGEHAERLIAEALARPPSHRRANGHA